MLQLHTAEPILISTLRQLMEQSFLAEFYLVGGTALALQIGHRTSVDIDLFTHINYSPLDLNDELIEAFGNLYQKTSSNRSMLFSYLNEIKVDFVNNKTPLLYPLIIEENIRMADIRDIATLKMNAIYGRGSKKDFIDLYVLLEKFSVEELVELFHKKFPNVAIGQLLISMYYFGNAEQDAMPKLFISTNWEKIKKTVASKMLDYLKS